MAQDPTISPQRPQANHSHPALQSTPQAKGSATISEHINTVGVQVSDIRPWITRDVERFQECGIDGMLKDLLVDCTNNSQSLVDETYKRALFEKCLHKVLPICNGEYRTPVEGIRAQGVKEALRQYSGIKTEKELYPVFAQAANTALLFLEELGIEDIRPVKGPRICFHVNDPMEIQQKHQDHVSRRKPDVVVVSNEDVCDKDGSLGDICCKKDLFLGVAPMPPVKPFEWRSVRTFVEFKKPKNGMEPPPERYYSHPYVPPQEEYLTLDVLSEPDLDVLPEALVPPSSNPRSSPQEPVRRSARQSKTTDSNARKRNSDHLGPAESRSKRTKHTPHKKHPAIVQAGYYAAELFTAYTARLHAFGIVVVGDILYFWRYDRQGTVQCSGLNFVQDLPRFLVLLLAMQRFREPHWGLHPDIDPKFGPRPEFHKTTLSSENGKKIEVTLDLSDQERASHYGLEGRATNVFSVQSDDLTDPEDTRELVVKVFWAEATRTSEPEILKRVCDIAKDDEDVRGHVPDMLWYKAFKDASTAKFRERLGLRTEGARVLYMIIFRKLRPINELTGRDFLHAWWETVLCHFALWKKKVYHRDISPSNLMYRIVNGKIVGVLNDFDLASINETATGTERTGTIPFVALDLLDDQALEGHVNHAYKHDAESFIWVLAWISLRYDDGRPRKHGRPLDAWLRVDAVGCRQMKTDFLNRKANRQALVPGKGHEKNWELASAYLNALVMIHALTNSSLEDQDPYMRPDDAFKAYLSGIVHPFLEVAVSPGDGPREKTSQVVDCVSPEGACQWAKVGTSCPASESEWELVSTDTE